MTAEGFDRPDPYGKAPISKVKPANLRLLHVFLSLIFVCSGVFLCFSYAQVNQFQYFLSIASFKSMPNDSGGLNIINEDIHHNLSRFDKTYHQFSHDSYEYTPAQKCRLKIEKWLNPLIDEFVATDDEMPPIIDWVWDMGDHFLVSVLWHPLSKRNRKAYQNAKWNWQDQFGNNFTAEVMKFDDPWFHPMINLSLPTQLSQMIAHNQSRKQKASAVVGKKIQRSIPISLWPSSLNIPDNKTLPEWLWDLRPFVECDRIEMTQDKPSRETKIGVCTRFRGMHELVGQFIEYYRLIGVQHFWFYNNEEFNLTDLPGYDASDVTYVPYRFVWSEHEPYSRTSTGERWRLPFKGANLWQTHVQQQCLYRAKRYGLDWVMTQDLDEYLWFNESSFRFLQNLNASRLPSSLTPLSSPIQELSLLQQLTTPYENKTDVGALQIEGWAFGRDRNNSSKVSPVLLIDFIHYSPTQPGEGRIKLIYRVPTAKYISIHWLLKGGKVTKIPVDVARWNHYKNPMHGVQGVDNSKLAIDSSLRDKYHDQIVSMLQSEI